MLDAGGGGTPWSVMAVPTMWSVVEGQDTTAHWEILTGWRKSFELILQHMSQVKRYRENLTSAWPPQESRASAAYVARLDDLITNLQQTYEAAVANHTALSTATLSLTSARIGMKQIFDAYTANQAMLDEFNARSMPVQYGKAPVPAQKPPISDSQQEELNNRARVLMSELSTDLIQARLSITVPSGYNPASKVHLTEQDRDDTSHTAPTISPIVPVYPSNDGPVEAGGTSASRPEQAVVDSSNSARNPGLILGGVQPGLVSPPTAGQIPVPSSPVVGIPLPGSSSSATVVSISPTVVSGSPGAKPTLGQPPPRGGFIGNSPPGGGQPITPNRVIGAVPGMVPNGSGAPASRVNPIGGVISPPNQLLARGKSGVGDPVSTIAGRPLSARHQSDAPNRWDPNDPWRTAEGVPPILAPMPEQRMDPGPAIGLV